jgi:hypothetical protein
MRRFIPLFAFLILCTLPAAAADDTAAAQSVIRSQVEAMARDDAATAYSYAAPAIHQRFPEANLFLGMVQQNYAPVYRHKSFEFGEVRAVDGNIVDAEGVPWEALYTLEQQDDGSLKISGCMLIKTGQGV